jgi:hypothetical protein
MAENQQNVRSGRKVLFIGGPEAGNARHVPESVGDYLQGEADYMYRIWPFRMEGSTDMVYFAYAANQHPMKMLIDLWREYSPSAQIQRNSDVKTYQKVQPSP